MLEEREREKQKFQACSQLCIRVKNGVDDSKNYCTSRLFFQTEALGKLGGIS